MEGGIGGGGEEAEGEGGTAEGGGRRMEGVEKE